MEAKCVHTASVNIHTATGNTVLKEECGRDEEPMNIKEDGKKGGGQERRHIRGVMRIQGKYDSVNHLPL